MSTYQPNGDGTCKRCGRDVGAHDGGHEFVECYCLDCSEAQEFGEFGVCAHLIPSPLDGGASATECGRASDHPIHDIGRVLRCPEVK